MDGDRRLIEETFPIKEVSEIASREKTSRSNNISTIHIWWARKPHSVSRTTQYASLTKYQDSNQGVKKYSELLKKLAQNLTSLDYVILDKVRKNIITINKERPKILDPFCGGGTIPFEGSVLDCETYASDYNPVATIISKCAAEYPQKFGSKTIIDNGLIKKTENKLLKDFRKWSKWVSENTVKELEYFYSNESDYTDVAFIWARIINCQNPKCRAQIPLMNQFWLQRGENSKISLCPIIKNKKISFKIIGTGYSNFDKKFNPDEGNVKNANAECLVCNSVVAAEEVRSLFRSGKSDEELIAIVSQKKSARGKKYRIATKDDKKKYEDVKQFLDKKSKKLFEKWGINPVPNEIIHVPLQREYEFGDPLYNFNSIVLYGITTWGDCFNMRQKLVLITLVEKSRDAYSEMIKIGMPKDYAKALLCFLALAIDRIADFNSKMCIINPHGSTRIAHTFGQGSLQIMWTYAESNPLGQFGASWKKACDTIEKWLELASEYSNNPAHITCSSATNLPYSDNFFDAVFTDPPYFDMVPYSMLSDFFYVWQKRVLIDVFPEFFSTILTPKSDEIINEVPLLRRADKKNPKDRMPSIRDSDHFQTALSQSFREIYRVLKSTGIVLIIYAHNSTKGWEDVIESLLESNLIITAVWPINTELKSRLRSQDAATLASSIYMVCRKWKKEPHETYDNVKKQMQEYLGKKLDFLWSQNIKGGDFFISAIGSAIEVFGKYERITDNADNEIKVPQLLEDVRKIVSEYAITKVLRGDIGGEISTMTRFYVLWRSAYGQAKVPFDDARKLATSLGVNLEQEWNKGFIKKEKEFIRVIGPEDRSVDEIKEPTELIDVLHKALILWRYGGKESLEELLTETGYANNDTFRRVAQAISESLPDEIQEKKWLDGFLTGFTESGKTDGKQTKLF